MSGIGTGSAKKSVRNQNESIPFENGLVIPVNEKEEKAVSTLTMWDIADISGGYQLIGSPILYSTQTVEYVCEA